MNAYIIAVFLLFVNIQHIKCGSNSLLDFYPKLRDEYMNPYMQLYGGNYFPWKLLELVPISGRFSRPIFPSLMANKKIDPMLFKVGIGKKNYESIDPFLFKIGLGKKLFRKGEEGEQQTWQTKNKRINVEAFRNGFGNERKRNGLLSSEKATKKSRIPFQI